METKKIFLLLLVIVFVVLLYFFFFNILAPEAPFDFAEGKNQIDKIVSDAGLKLPEYSKSHFKDEIKVSDIKAFSCGATSTASIHKAKTDIENYKKELGKYKRTHEIEAIETYADIVASTLDAALISFDLERSNTYSKIESSSEEINDYNILCTGSFEKFKASFVSLENLFSKLEKVSSGIDKLARSPNYARQADVSTEFSKGVSQLKSAKSAISESEPKINAICSGIKSIQDELKDDPFSPEKNLCSNQSLSIARIDKVLALCRNVVENAQQAYEIFIKYRVSKIGNFSIEKLLEIKREFRAYELFLETLKEQLEVKCTPPVLPK